MKMKNKIKVLGDGRVEIMLLAHLFNAQSFFLT